MLYVIKSVKRQCIENEALQFTKKNNYSKFEEYL